MCAGLERAGGAHILERLVERLLGQRVHQIEIEIVEAGGVQLLDGAVGVLGDVNAAEPRERSRRESSARPATPD